MGQSRVKGGETDAHSLIEQAVLYTGQAVGVTGKAIEHPGVHQQWAAPEKILDE